MNYISEAKDLVFGKLSMVSEKVNDKLDVQKMKDNVTASYTKAIATVEEVPTYLKDSYNKAIAKIEDLHIYDNAVHASKAVFDPTTYKKLLESALQAVDAFKQALVSFTKNTTTSIVDTAKSTKTAIATKSYAALNTTYSSSIYAAVKVDETLKISDAVQWSLDSTKKFDNYLLGGRAQMVAVPVAGFATAKVTALDDYILNGTCAKAATQTFVDYTAEKVKLQYVSAK